MGASINPCEPEKEKLFVNHASQSPSKTLNLGVERFCCSVCRAFVVEVQYVAVMFMEGFGDDVKR